MSSSSSNDSSRSSSAADDALTHSRGSTFASASRRLNRRFSIYLDELSARRVSRLERLVAAFGGVGVAAGGAGAYFALRSQSESPWLVLLTALAVACALSALMCVVRLVRFRREIRRLSRVVRGGVPVNGFLVQSSLGLHKPQNEPLPCQVLISFQPEVSADFDYMRHLARRAFSMKSARLADREGRRGRTPGGGEGRRGAPFYRRRQLPLSFTDGSTIYCAELWVRPSFLKDSCLRGDVLPCIAEPGADGGIELVPWWLLGGPEAPSLQAAAPASAE